MALERVQTGIKGLDQMIEGGLVRGSSVLVSGTPGSGKTTLAMQFLVEGARASMPEPGVFISFEEDLRLLRENFLRFGWSVDELERSGRLVLVQRDSTLTKALLNGEAGELASFLDRIKARRLAIDSVSVMMEGSDKVTRRSLGELVGLVRGRGATALFVHERSVESVDGQRYEPLDFLFDGILLMSSLRTGNAFKQVLRVPKMRYTRVLQRIVPIQIGPGGVAVHPEMAVFE